MLNHFLTRLNEHSSDTTANSVHKRKPQPQSKEQFNKATHGITAKDISKNTTQLHESILITPAQLKQEIAISPTIKTFIEQSKTAIQSIMNSYDDRLLVIIGPCSIHDPTAALDYAKKLKLMSDEFSQELLIVMRVFLEKPRTTLGWKGLINDPDLDESFDVNKGLHKARALLLTINKLGLATATEFLNINVASYISDLICWGAIGARTSQSQSHRELASALSFPVGFKNNTDGNTQIAIDAITSAKESHTVCLPNNQGQLSVLSTIGNQNSHLILRGGNQPNYSQHNINHTSERLKESQHLPRLMIDCSHGNSEKDHLKQRVVAHDIANSIKQGEKTVFGVMIESFLVEGRQSLADVDHLTYGQSTTDACINLEQSYDVLAELANSIRQRREINRQ
ncbi:3-deoxy-7-phosphoheptulonate synthase [Colwellia sp. RSH04]|uniref:3-deoxy-7-phosphoheptulonate synthase n=1 Tax=Colwellia sp. RSH04 TaxID=2305464 RepID=UPI000E56B39E|nr:3-deoxy-7-phosphoheptulonate synthase [Colwellia sp. RSH04]RHW75972.1 3-deoxy-7-phosphoheptulonate synthase [Colwellia sp. RSH04]